jgi:hypothetical protein
VACFLPNQHLQAICDRQLKPSRGPLFSHPLFVIELSGLLPPLPSTNELFQPKSNTLSPSWPTRHSSVHSSSYDLLHHTRNRPAPVPYNLTAAPPLPRAVRWLYELSRFQQRSAHTRLLDIDSTTSFSAFTQPIYDDPLSFTPCTTFSLTHTVLLLLSSCQHLPSRTTRIKTTNLQRLLITSLAFT